MKDPVRKARWEGGIVECDIINCKSKLSGSSAGSFLLKTYVIAMSMEELIFPLQ